MTSYAGRAARAATAVAVGSSRLRAEDLASVPSPSAGATGESPPPEGDTPKRLSIELPFPPSVNRIWRARTGANGKPSFYLDRRYETWKRVCDNLYMANKRTWKPITGNFRAEIVLDEKRRRGDADNRAKCPMDWLQRVKLITNDSQADDVRIRWGYAPAGCRIEIVPVNGG